MKRQIKANIILVTISVLVFIVLFYFARLTFGQISGNIKLNQIFYLIARFFGLAGFLFLSVLIISGDTARFFDRFFGMDKIIKFQRKFATIVFIFVLLHPGFFVLANKAVFDFLIPDFSVLPLALGILSFYIFIVVSIASKVYKRISYHTWQYIHVLTYVLFSFVLYHAINSGFSYYFSPIKTIYFSLLALVVVGLIYRAWYKIQNSKMIFVVENVKRETEDTFTIFLKTNKKFTFRAGQFCFLRINKKKLYARHPFTISSAPQDGSVCFTIKLKGVFTKEIVSLKAGEKVIVDGPFGIFDIESTDKDLVFIAGGVGIAPFMSIIKDKINRKNFQKITLIYGAKQEKELIFKNYFDSIKEAWFKRTYVLEKYIDREVIKKYVKNFKNSQFYICGPEPMKELCEKSLLDLGVRKHAIIIESFFW